ncbi:TIGR03862 family flavoprotein [Janthinobacterium sp. B9-8]|uniref:TIGR03862 family flavoprotein n=1 Tax=Janthinobacterium sp. B9-8 TaxID=1236179 RepID=UPI00061CDE7D|nr:TIGR03862 family flavoprotein [Janthinobacterium sp. B9-8]AMC36605.1 NAD(FAD)-utilizing dehydrogenase [Janthinobacterium sp. B9-8]
MTTISTPRKSVAIIGGGPAGLMAAEILSQGGVDVDLFDAMPSVGRKFLLAGVGGLNITHSESAEPFLARYGKHSSELQPLLAAFGNDALQEWVHGLGVETFVGSSGRVFPKEMKAAPLLRAWISRLRSSGVRIHVRHRWLGWNEAEQMRFATPDGEISHSSDATILALGGASWAKLGSDGLWQPLLAEKGVVIEPLSAANCGFDIGWSDHLSERFAGSPLKAVAIEFKGVRKQGEFVLTKGGVEGSLIYTFSAAIRDEIKANGSADILLDLAPGKSLERVLEDLKRPRGADSMASHLRRKLGIEGVKAGLLREEISRNDFNDMNKLAAAIKGLPLKLLAPRPIDEAISSAGGVCFEAMSPALMLEKIPGVFCAGEMLDWEAPTGGYLITACLASGRQAGLGALEYLNAR